jgi:PAS domain S-box-containing protein
LKQKKLNEAEGRFRRLIENTHDGIGLLDTNGKFTYVTPSVKRILGYETEEMEGSDPIAITHPEDREQFVAVLQNPGIQPGETVIGTYRMLHKNGSWRWLNANVTNLLQEPGIQAIVFNYKDVTERMVAIENLSKSEANLRSIFENTGTGLLLLDETYKIVAFNQQAAKWIECESGQQLKENSSYLEYVPSECREGRRQKLASVLTGMKLQHQLRGKKIRGKAKWYTISMRRIVEDNGESIGICISISDITERKEADVIIRDSEVLYRSLFNNSPLPKWVCDQKNLRYLEVNDTAIAHYGYSREEFLTLTAFNLRDKKDHAELKRFILSKGDKEYKSGKMQHIKKNGEKIFVEVVAHPIIYKGIKAYLVIAHDISKILQLQKELMQEKVNKQIEITRATIAAQEKERDEVGKELHDNVNQMLASVKLYLETYDTDKTKYNGLLQKSRQTITDSISEIRRISKSLAPPSLGNVTLKESLEELVLNLTLAGKTVKLLSDTLREDKLSRELKISVYRIAQEQINNIIKYSKASIVIISLEHDNSVLNLQIDDDGIGFDTAKKRTGIGITNIMNRAATFNGKVHIDSSPGHGCRLNIMFCL